MSVIFGKRQHNSPPTSESTENKKKKEEETKANEGPRSTVLAVKFDSDVRPLINLIDRLRKFKLDKDINLPAVAVIGDQSAGKSSVLEAISGVQLPRGTGIVTRCPLEIQMKKEEKGWKAKISYTDKDRRNCKEDIKDAGSVGEHVQKAQTEMTNSENGISDELITLEIKSPDVPDLTLIDLPGIARNAVKGQPKDIEEKIKGLIRKYIERQETIILAVVQCNVDIATCEAIKMAGEVDEKGCRTIGVLTKPDLIDKGAEERTLCVLNNMEFNLKKGYIIVKCRSQKEVNERKSLKDAIQSEAEFFRQHSHFGDLPSNQWGITNLATRLSQELIMHIKSRLPDLKNKIRHKLKDTDYKLEKLGPDPPQEIPEKRQEALKMVYDFMDIVGRAMKGESYDHKEVKKLLKESRICYEQLLEKAEKIGSGLSKPCLDIERELLTEMTSSRGREFVNYIGKFELVENTARKYVQKIEGPAIRCFEDVHDITTEVFTLLAEACFKKYPEFLEKAKDIVHKIGRKTSEAGRGEITRYFRMEDQVYSQDKTYYSSLSEQDIRADQRQPQPTSKRFSTLPQSHDRHLQQKMSGERSQLSNISQAASSLHGLVNSSTNPGVNFSVTGHNARPVNLMESDENEEFEDLNASFEYSEENTRENIFQWEAGKCKPSVNKAILSLAAYYKVATRRLCDVIPMMIQYHVIKEQVESLREDLMVLATDERVMKHLNEDVDTAAKRNKYQERQKRLLIAEKELDTI